MGGVFMKVNKATMNMLVKVDPYIMYGYPNLKTVRDLIYKRGFAKIGGQRIPITDNKMIEDSLGEKTKGAVICIEDIVNQIYRGSVFQGMLKVSVVIQDELASRWLL